MTAAAKLHQLAAQVSNDDITAETAGRLLTAFADTVSDAETKLERLTQLRKKVLKLQKAANELAAEFTAILPTETRSDPADGGESPP